MIKYAFSLVPLPTLCKRLSTSIGGRGTGLICPSQSFRMVPYGSMQEASAALNMAETLSPLIYWGQSSENVYLKAELNEIENLEVNMDDEELHFHTSAMGINGKNNYSCTIKFYLDIDADNSKYRVTGRNIEFNIRKAGKQNWPRLCYDPVKPAWLKIDFDHFAFEDDDSSTDDEKNIDKYIKELDKKEREKLERSTYLDIRMIYMVMYNLFQWTGYSMIVCILLYHLVRHGPGTRKKTLDLIGDQLTTVQMCALLEIIHPIVGWVKTGVFMPLIQVLGRNMVLFMVIYGESKVSELAIVWWLVMSWSSVEIIRYPFYMLQTIKKEVPIVTWLRYTVWIILYPAGFLCEGLVMMFALPYFEENGRWSVSLPNKYNIAFHFPTFLKIYMVAFMGGMYLLMARMYEQRKKKLGTGTYKKKVKSS